MLNINKIFLLLNLINISYCCSTIFDIEKHVSGEVDFSNEFIYTWLVVIYDIPNRFGRSYGGLIHPKAVITCAIDMKGHNVEHLIVKTDCVTNKKGDIRDCTTRDVMEIIYPDDYDGQPTPEKFYALLILTTPFYVIPTISPVNLINSMESLDKQSCIVTHLLRVYKAKYNYHGLVTEAFHIPYINGTFIIDAMDKDQLNVSRDFIIKREFFGPVIVEGKANPLVFSGSPVVCFGKVDLMPYQVGIATFSMKVSLAGNSTSVEHEGSLFLITDYFNEIMKKLEDNIT